MSEETAPSPETPPPSDEAKNQAPAEGSAPSTDAALPRAKIKLPSAAPGEAARPKLTIRKSTAAESGPAPSDPLFDAKKETVRIELPHRPGSTATVKLPSQPQAGPVQADHEAAEVKSSTVKLTIPRAAPPRPPAAPAAQQPKSETARISLPAQEQTPGVSSAALGASGLRIRREEPAPPPPPEPLPPEPPAIEEPVEVLPPVEEPAPEPIAPRRRAVRAVRIHAEDELDTLSAAGAILSALAALGVAAFLFLEWQKFSGMLQ